MATCSTLEISEAIEHQTTSSPAVLMVLEAIDLALSDEGFKLPTSSSKNAMALAKRMELWMKDDGRNSTVTEFSSDLIAKLKGCLLAHITAKKSKLVRERMWEQYYKVRCSSEFLALWKDAFAAMGISNSTPIFFQFVTEKIMESLIKNAFSISDSTHSIRDQVETPLSYEERNALRYTAGSVLHSLSIKVKRKAGSDEKSKELFCHISKIIDEQNNNKDEDDFDSRDWVDSIDRGGLTHVSDLMYSLFERLEILLRKYINTHQQSLVAFDIKSILQMITLDDDVQFCWSVLTEDIEDPDATSQLLDMIVEHWITLRGFSYASSIMEKYK